MRNKFDSLRNNNNVTDSVYYKSLTNLALIYLFGISFYRFKQFICNRSESGADHIDHPNIIGMFDTGLRVKKFK